MFDPHGINRTYSKRLQHKAQVQQAKLVNQTPPIDRTLVGAYIEFARVNGMLPPPPPRRIHSVTPLGVSFVRYVSHTDRAKKSTSTANPTASLDFSDATTFTTSNNPYNYPTISQSSGYKTSQATIMHYVNATGKNLFIFFMSWTTYIQGYSYGSSNDYISLPFEIQGLTANVYQLTDLALPNFTTQNSGNCVIWHFRIFYTDRTVEDIDMSSFTVTQPTGDIKSFTTFISF